MTGTQLLAKLYSVPIRRSKHGKVNGRVRAAMGRSSQRTRGSLRMLRQWQILLAQDPHVMQLVSRQRERDRPHTHQILAGYAAAPPRCGIEPVKEEDAGAP